jgi:hypothetical protein
VKVSFAYVDDGERLVADAVSRGALETDVSLRLGVLYAPEAQSTRQAVALADRGVALVIGRGDTRTSLPGIGEEP